MTWVPGPCAVCGTERPRGGMCEHCAAEVRRQRKAGETDPVAAAGAWHRKRTSGRKCEWCGGPIDAAKRSDARFCSDGHKARASESGGILRLARCCPTQAYIVVANGLLAQSTDPTAVLLRRLLAKVDVSTASEETCWHWLGAVNLDGVGVVRLSGRVITARRVVFELFERAIPPGHVVTARCANPRCVNPSHLEALDAQAHRARIKKPTPIGVRGSESERFWRKVRKDAPDRCWTWQASTTAKGYPQFRLPGQAGLVGGHVWAYRDRFGPVPAGFEVHHTCGQRLCVNPEHLRALPPGMHRDVDRERREIAA